VRIPLLGWFACAVIACASGRGDTEVDGPPGGADAPVGGIDSATPVPDAPVGQPDAMAGTPDAMSGPPDAAVPDAPSGACPQAPTNPSGCPSCGTLCDAPWPAAWTASAGATHYIVQYTCLLSMPTYQTTNTSVDLCAEVGMCNDDTCAFGAGMVTVSACNATCCSPLTVIPVAETPTACGGGVCC
jgi:hypothetical protein